MLWLLAFSFNQKVCSCWYVFHYCPHMHVIRGTCSLSVVSSHLYCKQLLWSHIIDGFTVFTSACHFLQKTHDQWMYPAGHSISVSGELARGLPWRPPLHEICVFKQNPMMFIWYQRRSDSRLWEWAQPHRALPSFPPTGCLAARSAVAPALAKCCSVFPTQICSSIYILSITKSVRGRKPGQGIILSLCL